MSLTDKSIIPSKNARYRQTGAALILIAFIIGLGAAAYLIKSMTAISAQANQDKKTYQTLGEAKKALIAWAVSHPTHPGMMPWPDRNTDTDFDGTSAYDGKSDCVTTTFQYSYLLGQLPWRAQSNPCIMPHTGLGGEFLDAQGNRLWYAVSRNLVYDYPNSEAPIINPGMINPPYTNTPYLRQGGTNSYPWLTVLDRNGNVVSDRVAAVIIASGNALGDQDRSSNAPDPDEYLDSFRIGGITYSNRGYATADEDFVIGEDSRNVSANDTSIDKPYNFNDKLVYITIDELMEAISIRAAAEARAQLRNYKNVTGYYPFASALVKDEYFQQDSLNKGFLPIQRPTQTTNKTCAVTYISANSSSTVCDSSSIQNIQFTRRTGTFNSVTGTGCIRTNANRTCSCNVTGGTSRCNAPAGRRFTCTSTGCTTTGNLPGSYVFNGTFSFITGTPTTVKVNEKAGDICSGCGTNTISCTSTSAASASFGYSVTVDPDDFNASSTQSVLPTWFTANDWQDYLYYAASDGCTFGQPCDITTPPNIVVGGKSSVEAVIVAAGAPLVSPVKGSLQTHSTACDVREYLDTLVNTDLDSIYESHVKARASNYNDQIFVVAP